MATTLRGILGSPGVSDFSGFAVIASLNERVQIPGADDAFVTGRREAAADRDGTFLLILPDAGDRQGAIELTVLGPDGLSAGGAEVPADIPTDPVRIRVAAPTGTTVQPSSDITLGQQAKYTGLAIDPQGRGVAADLLILIWARADGADTAVPVSVSRTSTGGYFSGPWVAIPFADAYATIAGGAAIRIPLEAELLPRRIVLQSPILPQPPSERGHEDDDCSCAVVPPRSPDAADLAANSAAYSTDGGRCVDLTVPNRTLDEVTYQAVVRTTQPQLKGTRPVPKPTIPEVIVGKLVELAQTRPMLVDPSPPSPTTQSQLPTPSRNGPFVIEASPSRPTAAAAAPKGIVASAARQLDVVPAALAAAQRFVPGIDLDGRWAATPAGALADRVLEQRALAGEPLQLEPSVLAELARETTELTPLRLVTAEHTSVVRRFRDAVGLLDQPHPQRFTLEPDRQLDWDQPPLPYQATTIAHGHLLTLRQVWRADGYSLGDLLYSLPLAPGQQKLISVLDWNRTEVASRRAERTEREDLIADLSHDRDINDVIRSSLSESMRGGSSASVSSVGGGLAGFIGPLVFGAAGGVSTAGSTANQTSARSVTGVALNHVRDRTLQSASAVRSQRSTVVQTARQGESVRAQTEVVANYNHCHALTVEYFEVLRHLQVSQELAAVQECLFIPFAVTPFTAEKALRWREPLQGTLQRPSLTEAFDALERVQTNWYGADVPMGRYADETLIDLDGDLSVRITLPRPADAEDGSFVESNWTPYASLLWDTPTSIWERYLGVALPESRNSIWDTRIAPGIAQRLLGTLTLSLIDDNSATTTPIGIDPAMIGLFSQDRPTLVGLQATIPLPTLIRSQIDRVRFSLSVTNLAAGARIVVDSGSLRYRTAHLSHYLFLNRRVLNDLSMGDDVEISTPLDLQEKRNPRDLDRRLADRLLDHLDEHVEYYNRAIWTTMYPNHRYLLLDGFVAPDAGGRSVASVVENQIIGVVGNSLVMPVAPGLKLDSTYEFAESTPADLRHLYAADPPPPMRISLPTSGVFAEAILGKCNSCEVIDDSRFWRWEEAPIPDQPPSIDPLSTGSRRSTPPNLAPDQFPNPVVGLQQTPSAPDPTGLTAAINALGSSSIFKDLTGLALNQANSAEALKTSITAAQGFASKAGALAQQRFLNQELDRSIAHVKDARDKGLITDDQARALTESSMRGAIGEVRPASTSATRSPSVQRAIDRVATSNSGSLRVTRPEGTVSVQTGGAAGRPTLNATVAPPVVPIQQLTSLVCWAAGGTMMRNWKSGRTDTVEAVLDSLGGDWRAKYDANQGLSVVQMRAFMTALSLTEDGPVSYTPEGLARLVEQVGPVLEIGDDGVEDNQISHVRIITGVVGDGTPGGTTVTVADPATGTSVPETFTVFDRLHTGDDPVALSLGVFHF